MSNWNIEPVDAFEFDSMDPVKQWEYFSEYGIHQDSMRKNGVDLFLFQHKELKVIYMELIVIDAIEFQAVRVIGGGEALVKYEFDNGEKPPLPWD